MLNIVTMLVLLLLAGLFFYLAIRAGRARRGWIKWPGLLLSGLMGLLLLVISGTALLGFYRLTFPPHSYSVADVQVAGTPEQLARGEKMAYICIDCHSSTGGLPLDGSQADLITAEAPPIGSLYGSNLTPAGRIKDWSDGEVIRAIREGVDNNGRPLLGMTSEPFSHLSDADAQALVAYLRAQPAAARDLPERNLNVLAALFVGAGLAPTSAQPPIMAPVEAPAPGTPDYGKYLIYTSGCRDCHGPNLTGGVNAFIPGGPNLAASIPAWNEAQFMTFIRTGVHASGREVANKAMPWQAYNLAFSDANLRDIFAYLQTLPAITSAD